MEINEYKLRMLIETIVNDLDAVAGTTDPAAACAAIKERLHTGIDEISPVILATPEQQKRINRIDARVSLCMIAAPLAAAAIIALNRGKTSEATSLTILCTSIAAMVAIGTIGSIIKSRVWRKQPGSQH